MKIVWVIETYRNQILGIFETAYGAYKEMEKWIEEYVEDEKEIQDLLSELKYQYIHCAPNMKSFSVEDTIYAFPKELKK